MSPTIPSIETIRDQERVSGSRARQLHNCMIATLKNHGDEIIALTPDEAVNVIFPFTFEGRRGCSVSHLAHTRRALRILREAQV